MITNQLQEYHQLLTQIDRLRAEVEAERTIGLAALPATFGYDDPEDFLRAFCEATGEPFVRTRAPRAPVVAPAPAPKGLAAAKEESRPPQPIASGSAAPMRPTGMSLDDPTNFGRLPDRSVLERGEGDLAAYTARLGESLRFATQVLHTSRVPAAVWREWRQFEREAADTLRAHRETPSSGK